MSGSYAWARSGLHIPGVDQTLVKRSRRAADRSAEDSRGEAESSPVEDRDTRESDLPDRSDIGAG